MSATPVKAVSGFAKLVQAVLSVVVVLIVVFALYSVWQHGLAPSIAWMIDESVQLLQDVSNLSEIVPDVPA